MLSEFRKQKVASLFADLDTNGDGQIEDSDVVSMIDNYVGLFGYDTAGPEYEDLVRRNWAFWDQIRQFDTNGDGAVSLADFLAGLDAFLEQRDAFVAGLNDIYDPLFAMIDRDGDGLVSEDDLVLHYRAWHRPETKAREAFLRLDRSHRGGISKSDWMQALEEFYYSDDPEAPGNWLAPIG